MLLVNGGELLKSKLSLDKLKHKYGLLYPNSEESLQELVNCIEMFQNNRSAAMLTRDKEGYQWLYDSNTVGMMMYVDLFADDVKGLMSKGEYLKELGITLIHLMPLMQSRQGENDGGYAVRNYRQVDEKLGDMEVFKKAVKYFHELGIRVCIDYVINHTSDDHEWALKAKEGDGFYQRYYYMYESDESPKAYEKTLIEVFPEVAPGNFTYVKECNRWVMTTFYPFQWDLNYGNPVVFNEMVKIMLYYAEIGIDLIRLDAIPYIWKALGTDCRNQPEAHLILSLFRDILELCAPATAILGEAIIAPDQIVTYFGDQKGKECHVLYNASYMVEIWNSLATRDARHLTHMTDYPIPDQSVWINYARCHDDIGWGLDEQKTRFLGFDPLQHKHFLIQFYQGNFEGSFATGELYEFNPKTMDARNSGTLASLAGLERALKNKDRYQLELALKRIYLIHALFILKKGIPMLYSGDEIGQTNDYTYHENDKIQHDSRWLHRPKMNWEIVKQDNASKNIAEMITQGVAELINIRKKLGQEGYIHHETVIHQRNNHVAIVELSMAPSLVKYQIFFNFSEHQQWVFTEDLRRYKLEGWLIEQIQGKRISLDKEKVLLGPYEVFVTKREI